MHFENYANFHVGPGGENLAKFCGSGSRKLGLSAALLIVISNATENFQLDIQIKNFLSSHIWFVGVIIRAVRSSDFRGFFDLGATNCDFEIS